MRKIIAAMALLSLAGCATHVEDWHAQDADATMVQTAMADCQEMSQDAGHWWAMGVIPAQHAREHAFEMCMKLKGYRSESR